MGVGIDFRFQPHCEFQISSPAANTEGLRPFQMRDAGLEILGEEGALEALNPNNPNECGD